MAGIERAKPEIGVQTGLQTSRPFRTDLPDPGAAISQGVAQLSGALMSAGREAMAAEADVAAKDAANTAVLTKNPETGFYDLPKAPSSFGWYAQKTFDAMVEEKTAQQTFYDQSMRLNEIASKNISNPEGAVTEMNAHIEGVLKGTDPRIAGRLQPLFARELQQRHFAIGQRVAARNEENLYENAVILQRNSLSSALDAASVGDQPGVTTHLENYLKQQETLVKLKRALPDTNEATTYRVQSLMAAGKIIQTAKERFGSQIMSPQDYDDLTRVAANQLAPGEKVLGFDAEWVRTNLSDPQVRNATVAHLQQMKSLTAEKWNLTLKEANYNAIAAIYDQSSSPMGKPATFTDEQMSQHITEWAGKTGVNLGSPEGLQQAFTRFAYVPAKVVKGTFDGIRNMGADKAEAALPLYRALDSGLTDKNGQTIPGQTNLIDARDQAFMYLYALDSGEKDTRTRYDRAVKALNAGLSENRGTHYDILKKNGGFQTNEDVEKALMKGLPTASAIPLFYDKLAQLPSAAQEDILGRAAILAATGVPAAKAVEMSQRAFKDKWTMDTNGHMLTAVQNKDAGNLPWVLKNSVPPEVTRVGDPKKSDTSWIIPYVRKALGQPEGRETGVLPTFDGSQPMDPNAYNLDVPKTSGTLLNDMKTPYVPAIVNHQTGEFKPLPTDAELGTSIFLQPNGKGGFALMYRATKNDTPQPIVDQKTNGMVISIYPEAAAKKQQLFAVSENSKRAEQDFAFGQTLTPQIYKDRAGAEGAPVAPRYTPADTGVLRAPADLRDFLQIAPTPVQGDRPGAPPKATRPPGGATGAPRNDNSAPAETLKYPPGFEPKPPEAKVQKMSFAPDETFMGEGQQAISAALKPPFVEQPNVVSAVTEQPERRARPDGYGAKLTGAITVNGNTYSFVNGGGGRGSIPFGEYAVSNFRTADQRRGQGLNDLGDTFDLSNVKDPMAPESSRTALRIHKSQGNGTQGCIGIVGGDDTFKQFVKDMQAAGVTTLRLGAPQTESGQSNTPFSAISQKAGSNAAIATDYFLRRGYSQAATAGIIGNLIGESNVDPAAASSPRITASKGIAQWLGTRLTGLQDFAESHKMDMRDLGTQLAFIEHELSSSEYRVKQKLQDATTVEEATAAFLGFERPRNYNPAQPDAHPSWKKRIDGARGIMGLIGERNV